MGAHHGAHRGGRHRSRASVADLAPARRPSLARTQVTLGNFLDVVKIALAIVAGIGGVVALVVAYRRQRIAERADAREDDAHLRSGRAEDRERTRSLNERFQIASQMLGSDKPAVRLAGVHAMANLADDWDDHEPRQMCTDVLCSYVRMSEQTSLTLDENVVYGDHLPRTDSTSPTPGAPATRSGILDREVRHTILRTIAAHLRLGGSTVSWQGHDFDLTGISIDLDPLDFSDAAFSGGQFLLRNVRFPSGANGDAAAVPPITARTGPEPNLSPPLNVTGQPVSLSAVMGRSHTRTSRHRRGSGSRHPSRPGIPRQLSSKPGRPAPRRVIPNEIPAGSSPRREHQRMGPGLTSGFPLAAWWLKQSSSSNGVGHPPITWTGKAAWRTCVQRPPPSTFAASVAFWAAFRMSSRAG
jgi:hypothetical protein